MKRDIHFSGKHLPEDLNKCMQVLHEHFDFAALKKENKRKALASLVIEAVRAGQRGKDLCFSCRKENYSYMNFYVGEHFTYYNVMGALKTIKDSGMFEINKVKPGSHRSSGLQSTLRATPRLMTCCKNIKTIKTDKELMRLKNDDGHLIAYDDTPYVIERRNRIKAINAYYRDHLRVSFPANYYVGRNTYNVEGYEINVTPIELHCVYTRSSWDCHGRLYSWHSNLEKDIVRPKLLINGHSTREWDFSALHPTMLFAEKGLQLDRDIYVLPGFDRDIGKAAFNIAVNAKSYHSAVNALREATGLPYTDCIEIMNAMIESIPEIDEFLFSDIGIKLHKKDSEIILDVVERLVDLGIPALPIHDSVIAPETESITVIGVMKQRFEESYPETNIRIKEK